MLYVIRHTRTGCFFTTDEGGHWTGSQNEASTFAGLVSAQSVVDSHRLNETTIVAADARPASKEQAKQALDDRKQVGDFRDHAVMEFHAAMNEAEELREEISRLKMRRRNFRIKAARWTDPSALRREIIDRMEAGYLPENLSDDEIDNTIAAIVEEARGV